MAIFTNQKNWSLIDHVCPLSVWEAPIHFPQISHYINNKMENKNSQSTGNALKFATPNRTMKEGDP
ncbi:hypothetical protein V6Z12_D06G202000 [Gossypium hirsutum]